MSVRVAAVRMGPVLGATPAMGERCAAAIAAAAEARAALVLRPELCMSGYRFDSRAEPAAAAETIPGPTTERWATLAARFGLVMVGGIFERDAAGALRNSVAVVDASGVCAVYSKLKRWGAEQDLFVAGMSRLRSSRPRPVASVSSCATTCGSPSRRAALRCPAPRSSRCRPT